MSEAAATLSLKIDTSDAVVSIEALEKRLFNLGRRSAGDPVAPKAFNTISTAARGVEGDVKHLQQYLAGVSFKVGSQSSVFGDLRAQMTAEMSAMKAEIATLRATLATLDVGSLDAGRSIKTRVEGIAGSLGGAFKLSSAQAAQFKERFKQAGVEALSGLEQGLTASNFNKTNQVLAAFSKNTEAELNKVIRMSQEAKRLASSLGGEQTAVSKYGVGLVSGAYEEEARAKLRVLATERSITEEKLKQQAAQKAMLKSEAAAGIAEMKARQKGWADLEAQVNRTAAAISRANAKSETYLSSSPRQQASQVLRASVAIDKGYDLSRHAPEAVAEAQNLGSVVAAKAAVDNLAAAHIKAAPAAHAHARATQGFGKAANDAHAFARGLSGSLGTLWMTYGSIVPLMAGAALAGGFMKAAKAGSEFAYQLTFVKALGGESANAVAQVGQEALKLSKDSLYGPVEAANGLRILSQAGLDAKQSIAALPSVMQLATVGEMNMEQASMTLVGVMNAFNMSLQDIPHIGDMFAKAAALSQTSVSGMTEAMKTASVVHDQYGASIEDTATAVTLLAKVNITGTAAGTAYRNMLKDIYTPSREAAAVLKQLGIETKDSLGNLRSAPDILKDLKAQLDGYTKGSQTDIIGKIFSERGGKEAIQMLGAVGDEWDNLKSKISNSDGFMAGVTAELEMTTKGRFKQALNTMESNMIKAFDSSESAMRGLADSLRNLADNPVFISGINAIVNAMAGLANTLVALAPVIMVAAGAWVAFKTAMLAEAGITAAAAGLTSLSTAMTVISAESALAGGGLAGLKAGLAATSGAAGVAAGATGLGGVAVVLEVLSGPVGWFALAATAAAGLWLMLDKAPSSTAVAITAADNLADALKRTTSKIKEEISALKERNRLLMSGINPDDKGDADKATAQNEVKKLQGEYDTAKAAIPKGLTARGTAMASYEADTLKDRLDKAKFNLRELEKATSEKLSVSVTEFAITTDKSIEGIVGKADELVAKARKAGNKEKVAAIEGSIEALKQASADAKNGTITSFKALREAKEAVSKTLDDARVNMLDSGLKTFTPAKPQSERGALRTAGLESRANREQLAYYASEQKGELDILNSTYQSKLISEEDYRQSVVAIYAKYEGKLTEGYAKEVARTKAIMESASGDARLQAEGDYNKALREQERYLNSKEVLLKKSIDNEAKIVNDGWARINKQIAEQEAINERAKQKLQSDRLKLSMTPEQIAYYDASQSSLASSDKAIADQKAILETMRNQFKDDGTRVYDETSEAIQKQIEMLNKLIEARGRLAASAGETAAEEANFKRSFEYGWASAFKSYSDNANSSAKAASEMFSMASKTMEASIVEFVTTGKMSFKSLATSILEEAARVMASKAVASMLGGITSLIGGMFGAGSTTSSFASSTPGFSGGDLGGGIRLPSANGNVFSGSSSLHQYANTVQTSPKVFSFDTLHGFAKGGVFAEAGPEAVMPLSRDSQGRLGVKSQGGNGGGDVNISITINESEGGQKTDANGDANEGWNQFAQRIKGMILDEMTTQKRPGGLLYG